MSDEVLSGAYSWQPHEQAEDPDLPELDVDIMEDLFGGETPPPLQPLPSDDPPSQPTTFAYPFIQNYIHDAESLWWILCWFLLVTHPLGERTMPEILKKRKEKWNQFFPEHDFPAERKNPKTNPFLNRVLLEHKEVPIAYQELYNLVVKEIRTLLNNTYKSAESLPDRFQRESMDDVHLKMYHFLGRLGRLALKIGKIEFADYVRAPRVIQGETPSQ
jgi:hypothetical protein